MVPAIRFRPPVTKGLRMRSRRLANCVPALVVLALAGATPAHAARTSGNLYLQQASGGTLTGSKLVLRGVAPRVTTFTDRPTREASSLRTSSFVSGFGKTFRGDPPNAALQIDQGRRGRDVALLELRRPRYDRRRRTLTYAVKRLRQLERGSSGTLRPFSRRADRGVRGRFGRSTLFIDSGGAGDSFGIVLSAPSGKTTSVTLTGNASFDLEDQTQITPLGSGGAPVLKVDGPTLSMTGGPGPAASSVVVMTWIDVYPSPLTGTAIIPAGGNASINDFSGGSVLSLSNGPFSYSFD